MIRRYKNVWHRPVQGIEPGEEGELEVTAQEEADYLSRGRLEIVPVEYEVVGPHRVAGEEPGSKFYAAYPIANEQVLVDAGHLERVLPRDEPNKSATREEWDRYAKKAGLDPTQYGSKDELIQAVAEHRAGAAAPDPDADKEA